MSLLSLLVLTSISLVECGKNNNYRIDNHAPIFISATGGVGANKNNNFISGKDLPILEAHEGSNTNSGVPLLKLSGGGSTARGKAKANVNKNQNGAASSGKFMDHMKNVFAYDENNTNADMVGPTVSGKFAQLVATTKASSSSNALSAAEIPFLIVVAMTLAAPYLAPYTEAFYRRVGTFKNITFQKIISLTSALMDETRKIGKGLNDTVSNMMISLVEELNHLFSILSSMVSSSSSGISNSVSSVLAASLAFTISKVRATATLLADLGYDIRILVEDAVFAVVDSVTFICNKVTSTSMKAVKSTGRGVQSTTRASLNASTNIIKSTGRGLQSAGRGVQSTTRASFNASANMLKSTGRGVTSTGRGLKSFASMCLRGICIGYRETAWFLEDAIDFISDNVQAIAQGIINVISSTSVNVYWGGRSFFRGCRNGTYQCVISTQRALVTSAKVLGEGCIEISKLTAVFVATSTEVCCNYIAAMSNSIARNTARSTQQAVRAIAGGIEKSCNVSVSSILAVGWFLKVVGEFLASRAAHVAEIAGKGLGFATDWILETTLYVKDEFPEWMLDFADAMPFLEIRQVPCDNTSSVVAGNSNKATVSSSGADGYGDGDVAVETVEKIAFTKSAQMVLYIFSAILSIHPYFHSITQDTSMPSKNMYGFDKVYDKAYESIRNKFFPARRLVLIGSLARGLHQQSSLARSFQPSWGTGALMNVGAIVADERWFSVLVAGWFTSGQIWTLFGAETPPCAKSVSGVNGANEKKKKKFGSWF